MSSLQANIRNDHGKGNARKLRGTGRVPAVIYGPDTPPKAVDIDPAALELIFKLSQNRNTVVDIETSEGNFKVMVREVQRHPLTRDILHVDFYHVVAGRPLEVIVPVRTEGRPAGAQRGGRLRVIRRELLATCSYENIPEAFVVDVSNMDIGDMVKASQIPTPNGVEVVVDHDFNVLTVYGKKGPRGGKGEA